MKKWKMKWTMHDVFGFLKPSKCKVWSSVIIAIILSAGSLVARKDLLIGRNDLVVYLFLSLGIGILIILYTLISIIKFFVSGEWRE